MTSRIVVLGASGYTGRLTVEALVRRGRRPVLAGRNVDKLRELAVEVGGEVDVALADASRPESVYELVGPGSVLLSTVGPFARLGDPVARAALENRAHYLDSNAEPAFTRQIFERYGRAAEEAGVGMLTAFGWECVLGNLAGALALREGGEAAVRVDTGYFYAGRVGFSGGTRASFMDATARPSFAFRDGAIRTVRAGDRYRIMPAGGQEHPGVSFGASEHFALPRNFPGLREVNAYQGWFGRLSPRLARPLHALSGTGSAVLRVRVVRELYRAVGNRLVKGSTGGPDADKRARGGVHVVGMSYDAQDGLLAEAHLSGAEGYEFTGKILAWGAERLAAGGLRSVGALGPVEAFGIGALEAGCREAGVARV